MNIINVTLGLQFLKTLLLLDALCTQSLSYSFENITTCFLPPKITSTLQSIDAAIELSFKAAGIILLINHVLDYILKLHRETIQPF